MYLGLKKSQKGSTCPERRVFFLMKKNWKLYLYYNGVLVKKIKIYEDEAPVHNSYVVRIWGKKHIFGSNVATVILRPVELLKNDEKHRKTHWGAIFERGVEM